MKSYELHYIVSIEDKDHRKLLEYAHSLGLDYGDAGPVETMKRLIMEEGISGILTEFPDSEIKLRCK